MSLCAQNRLDSLQRLDEVVVTAKALSKEVIPVQQLAGAQLQRLGAHSVADAIRYFSGVQIKDYGGVGGLKTVNIRSMGTNHVGVFYDGIELGNAQNGTVDLGRFSLDNMEAVTLYNGQKSALLQPAKDFASAGSIYLQSRTPRFAAGERQHVKSTFKTGSFGVVNPSIVWDRRLNERISSSVSAEYMYTTGRYKFTYRVEDSYDTTAVRRNGDVNAVRLEGGLFGSIKGGYWRAKAYLYRSERGYPGAVVKNKFSHEDRQWDTNVFAQGSFRKEFSPRYSLLINAKYAYDYLHYLADPRRDEALMYVNNRYYQHETYVSVANQYALLPVWDVSFSADYQFNLLDADLTDFVYPRRHTQLLAVATALRFPSVKMHASLLGTLVQDHVRSEAQGADNRAEWTPTVVVSYRPFSALDLNLRAFYKRIFRMPTLNDLYYTFIGNVDLEPEYTNQYNLGLTYAKEWGDRWLRRLEVQADVYYNEVENKIVAMPTSNFFRWTMVNLGKVEIRGIDLALQTAWQWGKNWYLTGRVNYTYQKAQDFTDPTDAYYGGQIPYIPWHSGSAVLNLNWREWEMNYSFIYTGERYSSRANIPVNYVLPWYTSDFSVSRTQHWGGGDLKLTLEVNNLFNQQYEVVICYPMPGTNFKAIVQYAF
ncbi:TonB-dependent receptor [Bacteroides sp. ET71]|uniref:TonB-dependent receptor n=1 Tax=Bacteroides sp. ET71 TaxID=2939421 RepID=UPI002011932B|nr:TonB-dependent receptor [Bacteroides sp. ET71]MCL1614869.1 TonB-dependent receptor [Bacteroides sp. ET71]